MKLDSMTAVLLVGGLGTRLRSVVSSAPKVLAPLGRSSFLQLLINQLRVNGIRRLVMCTGYLGEQIENEVGDGGNWGMTIEYSKEEEQLGTAGAIKRASPYLAGLSDFLVMNGDSFLEVDFPGFLELHLRQAGLAAVAVHRVDDASRYGTVQVDGRGRVVGFSEKAGTAAPGLVNGGVYLFSRRMLECIPDQPASLERDVFPRLLPHGLYAQEQRGMFIDIGTPADYGRAQQLCDSLSAAASKGQDPSATAGS